MFVAEMANHCGIRSWKSNSQIVYAQSNNGWNSSFTRKHVWKTPFAHSPLILKIPNITHNANEYALFYVHNQSATNNPVLFCFVFICLYLVFCFFLHRISTFYYLRNFAKNKTKQNLTRNVNVVMVQQTVRVHSIHL